MESHVSIVACTSLCMTVEAQVQKDSPPCAVLFAKNQKEESNNGEGENLTLFER